MLQICYLDKFINYAYISIIILKIKQMEWILIQLNCITFFFNALHVLLLCDNVNVL